MMIESWLKTKADFFVKTHRFQVEIDFSEV